MAPLEGYIPEQKPLDPQESINLTQKPENKDISGLSEGQQVLSEDAKRMKRVQEVLSKFEKLAQGKEIDGFDVFQKYILESSSEIQDEFLIGKNLSTLKNKILESHRFPVNEFELKSYFMSKDSEVVVAEKTEEVAEKTEEVADTYEKIKEQKERLMVFKRSVSGIQLSDTFLVGYLNELDITEVNKENADKISQLYDNIKARLSQTREIETTILPQAKKNGNYEEVKNSLVSLSPDFAQRIEAWEVGEEYPKVEDLPLEQQTRVDAALEGKSNQAEKSGNIFTLKNRSGQDIQYDVVTGERALVKEGYTMKSQVEDTGDYYTPKLEYTKVLQKEGEIIDIIGKIYMKLAFKKLGYDDLAEIKATIRSIPEASQLGINFETLDSGEDIAAALSNMKEQSENTITDAKNTYKKVLDTLKDAHIIAQKIEDKKKKDVLDFLQSIGITRIPQYIIDTLIDAINTNTAIWSALGLQEKIDFPNGKLGFDKNAGDEVGLNLADKQSFVSLMNTMLTGDPKIPVEYTGSAIMYNIDTTAQKGETPDEAGKGAYQTFLARTVGDISFVSKAKRNLGLI